MSVCSGSNSSSLEVSTGCDDGTLRRDKMVTLLSFETSETAYPMRQSHITDEQNTKFESSYIIRLKRFLSKDC